MKQKELLALLLASIGLVGLALAGSGQPEKVKIKNIDTSNIGEEVLVEGKVVESSKNSKGLFMTVSDGSKSVSVTGFDTKASYQRGDRVRFTGRVTLYEGDLGLVVDKFLLPEKS